MKLTARDRMKLKPLEDIINTYGLGDLPTTDTAMWLHQKLDADTLMSALDLPAINDTDFFQGIEMTPAEFREAHKQALFLHVMLRAESTLERASKRN